jgi:hypothetical protein
MPSRDTLLKLADEYKAEAEVLERRAADCRRHEKELRAAAAEEVDMNSTDSTLRTMDVNTSGKSPALKRGVARATRKHIAQQKFYAAGKTISDIAVELHEGRERVSSWMAKGDACRPIPSRHVEYLKKHYDVPRSAWAKTAD